MKTFTRYNNTIWLLLCTIICLNGCSEDIVVIQPGPPIPVVYGVFDLNQTVHHIKLSKSFAGESDPYTLAGNAGTVFYTDAEVFLSQGPGTSRTYFKRETGIPRNTGDFPAFPNESYVLDKKLYEGDYFLTVILPTEKDTVTARFSFINGFKVVTPKAGFKRFYLYEDPILFSWSDHPEAGLYEISLILQYEEWMKTGEHRTDSVNYTRQVRVSELEHEKDRYNYRFYSDSFFARLGTSIVMNAAVDYRRPTSLELIVTAADTTLSKYLNWFNLEIDDQVNPNGNVEGAIGVVGTKYSVPFHNLTLSPRAQDSLVRGRYTRKLDFVNNPDW